MSRTCWAVISVLCFWGILTLIALEKCAALIESGALHKPALVAPQRSACNCEPPCGCDGCSCPGH